MHAVHAQFMRNSNDDKRQTFQALNLLSTAGYPWRKLGTGNILFFTEATTSDDEVYADKEDGGGDIVPRVVLEVSRRLIEWWEQESCASRMTLAAVGKGESGV